MLIFTHTYIVVYTDWKGGNIVGFHTVWYLAKLLPMYLIYSNNIYVKYCITEVVDLQVITSNTVIHEAMLLLQKYHSGNNVVVTTVWHLTLHTTEMTRSGLHGRTMFFTFWLVTLSMITIFNKRLYICTSHELQSGYNFINV